MYKYLTKMQIMKTIIITVILIITFSCNSLFAGGNIKIISKKNKMEISLKIKTFPYSFIKNIYKPNPIT